MPEKDLTKEKDVKEVQWQDKPSATKKRTGQVVLVIPNKRIVIEYGNALGTEIPYNDTKHKNIKIGDTIEF
jgi:hypothetical protein